MSGPIRRIAKLLTAALLLFLAAGCGVNSTFVYKPGAPAAGVRKLPVNVAVLPFKDGTEDYTTRGSVLDGDKRFNLAKTGSDMAGVTALTPELWSKALADDLAASGAFNAVRFVYGPSELTDEEIYIEGTLEKADYPLSALRPKECALTLRALRRTDNRPVWEKGVEKAWTDTEAVFVGCGDFEVQCRIGKLHGTINAGMQGMFAEAREDLVRALARLPGSGAGVGAPRPAAVPESPSPESVDREIERILKGN